MVFVSIGSRMNRTDSGVVRGIRCTDSCFRVRRDERVIVVKDTPPCCNYFLVC